MKATGAAAGCAGGVVHAAGTVAGSSSSGDAGASGALGREAAWDVDRVEVEWESSGEARVRDSLVATSVNKSRLEAMGGMLESP